MSYGIAINSPCAAQVKEASQIESRFRDLLLAADELSGLVAGLQVRLQDVLTPQMKGEGTNTASTPKPIVAPMVERLEEARQRINNSNYLLRDMIERVAL